MPFYIWIHFYTVWFYCYKENSFYYALSAFINRCVQYKSFRFSSQLYNKYMFCVLYVFCVVHSFFFLFCCCCCTFYIHLHPHKHPLKLCVLFPLIHKVIFLFIYGYLPKFLHFHTFAINESFSFMRSVQTKSSVCDLVVVGMCVKMQENVCEKYRKTAAKKYK